MSSYKQLADSFTKWAIDCDEIRTAIQVGSRVQSKHKADEWADIDIMLFTTKPEIFLSNTSWLEEIGNVLISVASVTAGGDREILVLFEGGCNIDYVLIHDSSLINCVESGKIPDLCKRGFRALIDKDGIASKLRCPAKFLPTHNKPSQEDFASVIKSFWFGAVYNAKQLCRGNLWRVKLNESGFLSGLTRMIELHTHATKGWGTDTFYMGRYMEDWADQRIIGALNRVFAIYSAKDMWNALFAQMELIRWMNRETAGRLGYRYPEHEDAEATALVTEYYSEFANSIKS